MVKNGEAGRTRSVQKKIKEQQDFKTREGTISLPVPMLAFSLLHISEAQVTKHATR